MALFRVLHASDLHVGRAPFTSLAAQMGWLTRVANGWPLVSHNPAALRAFVRFAFNNRRAFDTLLISGDLATTGSPRDLRSAYRLCSDRAATPGVCMTASGEPTLTYWAKSGKLDILPGNHDRYRSRARLCRPGGSVFDDVFCPTKGPQLWCAGQGVAPGTAIRKGSTVVHIIKADFSLRRGDHGRPSYRLVPGWLGQGRVNQVVLDELVSVTDNVRDQITRRGWVPITLWAIHFDPTSSDPTLALLDSKLFGDAADTADVSAVLCGHTHETKIKPLSSRATALVCGTTSQARSSLAALTFWDCQVIELECSDDDGTLDSIRVQWYRYERGQFRLIGAPSLTF